MKRPDLPPVFVCADTAAPKAAERNWQFDRLILWLSEDEPEDWPLPERVTKEAA